MYSPQKSWKEKAVERQVEIKHLKKRLEETRLSRTHWRNKYKSVKAALDELRKENEELKKKELGLRLLPDENGVRPKNYHYSIFIIRLSLILKLETSASFNMIHQLFEKLQSYFQLISKAPSAKTILSWVLKLGYTCLTRTKTIATDWILILDESINIGSYKLFVIYGIRQSSLSFERPLQLRDLTPLWIKAQPSWTGDKVADVLSELKKELGTVIYAIADHGAALKKGLRLTSITHIYDITHKIAAILKSLYSQEPSFKAYTQKMAQMRTKLSLSTIAHIVPPNQRSKSRYLNLNILAKWGMNTLNYLDSPDNLRDKGIRESLGWVQEKEKLITELASIQSAITQIEKLLKTKGISKEVATECQDILKNFTEGKALQFKEQFQKYLTETLAQLPEIDAISCSSDIIESGFGKYKNYLSQNPMVGFTPLALCMAAFTSTLTKPEIIQALENTTNKNIQKWAENNIGKTLLQKRNEVFSKNGAKN